MTFRPEYRVGNGDPPDAVMAEALQQLAFIATEWYEAEVEDA